MNDEFLYALRRKPPRAFAQKLKQQLDRQASQRAVLPVRGLLMMVLLGASALAGTFLVVKRHDIAGSEQHVSSPTKNAQVASSASKRWPEGRTSWSRDSSHDAESAAGGRAGRDASHAAGQSRVIEAAAAGKETSPQVDAALGRIGAGGAGASAGSAPNDLIVVTSELARPFTSIVVSEATLGVPVRNAQVVLRTEEAEEAFRRLCSGGAFEPAVIAVTSRRISADEAEHCRRSGVPELSEFKLGYQALVVTGLATSVPIKLSPALIRRAVARRVRELSPPFKVIDNPYRSWDQIDPRLDPRTIEVLGPARDKSLRRLMEEKVLRPGCETRETNGSSRASDAEIDAGLCFALRTDGMYREVEQTHAAVVQVLWSAPHAIALVNYNFYRFHRGEFAGSMLAGVEPTNATLADGSYPLASPLYVYANANAIRGERGLFTRVYLNFTEFVFDRFYLERAGITPIDESERKAQFERQRALRNFSTNTKQ